MSSRRLSRASIEEVSEDARGLVLELTVVDVHSVAVNCRDERGRRWSLIEKEEEFQPRSVLTPISGIVPGSVLFLDLRDVRVGFDARLPRGFSLNTRWRNLVREWSDVSCEPDLGVLEERMDCEELCGLSGLGPGLTPAGDDFIAGWITARRCVEAASSRRDIRLFCDGWNPAGTTWFSRWMICDAIRGRLWRRGKNLLAALQQDDGSEMMRALSDIWSWGHTSGKAWLAGLGKGFERSNLV